MTIVPRDAAIKAVQELAFQIYIQKQAAIEKLTKDQFAAALIQAIESGDFIRNVSVDEKSQQVVYIPFRMVQELKAEIEELKKAQE